MLSYSSPTLLDIETTVATSWQATLLFGMEVKEYGLNSAQLYNNLDEAGEKHRLNSAVQHIVSLERLRGILVIYSCNFPSVKIILSYGCLPNPAQAAWGGHKCSNVRMRCGDCQRVFAIS